MSTIHSYKRTPVRSGSSFLVQKIWLRSREIIGLFCETDMSVNVLIRLGLVAAISTVLAIAGGGRILPVKQAAEARFWNAHACRLEYIFWDRHYIAATQLKLY